MQQLLVVELIGQLLTNQFNNQSLIPSTDDLINLIGDTDDILVTNWGTYFTVSDDSWLTCAMDGQNDI